MNHLRPCGTQDMGRGSESAPSNLTGCSQGQEQLLNMARKFIISWHVRQYLMLHLKDVEHMQVFLLSLEDM